jgi:hypothetical protein
LVQPLKLAAAWGVSALLPLAMTQGELAAPSLLDRADQVGQVVGAMPTLPMLAVVELADTLELAVLVVVLVPMALAA